MEPRNLPQQFAGKVVRLLRGKGGADGTVHPVTAQGDEIAALLRGLRLAVIAVVSAVLTAALVIGWGDRERDRANPYYGDLVTLASSGQ